MTFKSFLQEKKFFTLTPEEEKQTEELSRHVLSTYNTPKKIQALEKQVKNKKVRVGTFKVYRRDKKFWQNVGVYIDSLGEVSGYYTRWNPTSHRPEIVIDLDTILGIGYRPDTGLVTLKHEIGHAVQNYMKQSQKYRTAVDTGEYGADYYLEPLEFQIQEADIMNLLKHRFNKLREQGPREYNFMIPKFKSLIMNFLRKDWKHVNKDHLPLELSRKYEFISTIAEHPTHMRAFKQKLYNFIENIPLKYE